MKILKITTISAFIAIQFIWGKSPEEEKSLQDLKAVLKNDIANSCYSSVRATLYYGNPRRISMRYCSPGTTDEFYNIFFNKTNGFLALWMAPKETLQNSLRTDERLGVKEIIEWIAKKRGISLSGASTTPAASAAVRPAAAATDPTAINPIAINGGLSEEEALQRTMEASLQRAAASEGGSPGPNKSGDMDGETLKTILSDPEVTLDEQAKCLRAYGSLLTLEALEEIRKNNPGIVTLKAWEEVSVEVMKRESSPGARHPAELLSLDASIPEMIRALALGINASLQKNETPSWGDFWTEVAQEYPLNNFYGTTQNDPEKRKQIQLIIEAVTNPRREHSISFRPTNIPTPFESVFNEHNLSPITTPGFGNCTFDAALLSLFAQTGLYDIGGDKYYNLTFGQYLEAAVKPFRILVSEIDLGLDASLDKKDVAQKDKVMVAMVFYPIAVVLQREIMCFSLNDESVVVATIYYSSGKKAKSIIDIKGKGKDEFEKELQANPNMIFVFHSGVHYHSDGHYTALTRSLPKHR